MSKEFTASPFAMAASFLIATQIAGLGSIRESVAFAEQIEGLELRSGPMQFHRAFVPDEVIRNTPNYLPMKQRDFENLVRNANLRTSETTKPYLESADYQCRVRDRFLVDGIAKLIVSIPSRRACTLSLGDLSIAISNATWLNREGAPWKRASLGRAPPGFGSGSTLVIPESIAEKGSATLSLQWTLAGTLDAFDSAEFELGLPAALTTSVRITAEQPVEITSNRGLVQKMASLVRRTGSNESSNSWEIRLGGHAKCHVVVSPERALEDNAPIIYRQTNHYAVSLAGTEIDTQIHVSKTAQPIRRFSLETNANVQLKRVDWNGTSLAWRSSPATYLDRQYITVLVPTLSNVSVDTLSIKAVAPVRLNALSPLEAIRPRQMHWRSGTAEVAISDELRLIDYEIRNARQVRSRNIDGPQLSVVAESPKASVALHLVPATSPVRIANGVTAEFGRDSITAESVVELRDSPANWYRLVAEVHQHWGIEEISADNSELIGDWETLTIGDQQLLEIEIRPSVTGVLPTLRIRATRSASNLSTTITQAEVTPLTFRDVEYLHDIRCLRSSGGLKLELDAPLGTVGTESPNDYRHLIAQRPGDLVYPFNPKTSLATIQLQKVSPRFAANTNVVLRVGDTTVSEEFEIQWLPQDSKIERTLVHLSRPRDIPPKWTFVEPSPYETSPRRLAPEEQERAGLGTTGETWEFTMQDLGTEPRAVRGYREFTPADPENIVPSLIMLPAAQSQRATLRLENESLQEYRISASEIETAFIPSGNDIPSDTTIGSFRYSPQRHAVKAATPIRLVPSNSDDSASLVNCWAWTSRLDSHYSPDGTTQHRFAYRVENHGRRTMEFTANAGMRIRRITLGDVVIVPDEDQSNIVRVDLPRNESDVLIVVDVSSRHEKWGLANTINVDFLKLDVPVVQSQWTIWLPDNYQPLAVGRRVRRRPIPWTEQIFGWAGQHSQRLGSWSAIRSLISAGRLESNPTTDRFKSALRSEASTSLPFGQQRTWGEILNKAATKDLGVDVVIDQRSLREVGITPEAPFAQISSESIDEVLTLKGVLLVLTRRGLLVSTNQRRGLWAESFAETIWPNVFQLRRGAFDAELENKWEFPLVQEWSQGIGTFALHAKSMATKQTIASQRILNAWHVDLSYSESGNEHGTIRVLRKQISQVAGWLCFAISLTLVWQVKPYIPFLSGGMLLAGILTLFSTGAVQPLALGLMFGTVFGFFMRHVHFAISRKTSQQIHSGSTIVRSKYKPFSGFSTIPVWFWLLVWVLAASPFSKRTAHAQFDTATQLEVGQQKAGQSETRSSFVAANDTQTIGAVAPPKSSHRVLLRIDETQRPIGEYLYLPKDFYHQLFELNRSVTSSSAWLFRRASYRGRMAASKDFSSDDAGGISFDALSVIYEVETFRENVRVPIPLPRTVILSTPSAVRLDGRNIRPLGRHNATQVVQVALPGVHQIRLTLAPSSLTDPKNSSLRLTIPRIPQTTFSLDAPRQVEVQVTSALGRTFRTDSGLIESQLGPTSVLAVQWQPTLANQPSDEFVRLVSLLELQLGQAYLQTKIRMENGNSLAPRRTIELSFDDSMRWLPTGVSDFVRSVDSAESGRKRLRVSLNREGTTDRPIQFLLNSPRASRSLTIPTLTIDSVPRSEHWFGVRSDDGVTISYPENSASVSEPRFVEAWGGDSVAVEKVLRVPSNESARNAGGSSLGIARESPVMTCDEVTEVLVEGAKAFVEYTGQVTVTGERFKHLFRTPIEMLVRNVKVLNQDRELEASWSQSDRGTIVFVATPLSGDYRIELTGELDFQSGQRQRVPLVWVAGATKTNHRLHVYRKPRTTVSLERMDGFRERQELSAIDLERGAWRIADLQTSSPESAVVEFVATPTAPELESRMLTTVSRGETGWKAKAEYLMKVTESSLSQVTIPLPPSWRETISVNPEILFTTVESDGDARSLQLWFEEPIRGEVRFEILGSLDISESVSVPELRPDRVASLESFVRVPTATINERLKWVTSLLTAEEMTTFPTPSDSIEYDTYRASPGFRAELDSTQPRENLPHVSLTEVHYVVGRLVDYGVATYHLEPSGDPSTVLTMPDGSILLDASVGGLPAQVRPVDSMKYHINLGTTRLPHRLRVAYQIPHAPRNDATWTLSSPVLALSKNSNGRILWTLSTLDDTNQTSRILEQRSLSRLEVALARVSALRRLFEAPDVISIDYSDPEVTGWYRHWRSYFVDRIDNARRLLNLSENDVAEEILVEGRKTVLETESRLQLVEQQLVGHSNDVSTRTRSLPSAPPLATEFGSSTEYYSTGPGITTIQVKTSTVGQFDYISRLIAATLMLAFGCVLAFGSDSKRWENWLIRRWPLFLCGLGILWWFALYPRGLGVVFFALGIFCINSLRRSS